MYQNDTMSSESLILRAESSYLGMNVTEITMAQKVGKARSGQKTAFPPEANGEFEIVSEAKIAEWREKLNERFSIGKGKLKVISEPSRAS